MERAPLDPRALLADADFVRALARTLIRDAGRAEDLEQETWVAVLEHPPGSAEAPRGWLLTVLRNFARRFARADARRARRERAAAHPEAVPSTHEIVAREEARSRVVDAVLALEEPYRSAVILRFYEDLPPRAIAKRLAVPVETARTRLKRGLARLRARLDREWGGDRPAWCAALAPFAAPKAGIVGALAGGVAMSVSAKVAISAALLIGLGVSFWPESPSPAPEVARSSALPSVPEILARFPEPAVESPSPTRSSLESSRVQAPESQPQGERSSAVRYRGSVLERGGNPVARAHVRLVALETGKELGSTESGAGGTFHLSAEAGESSPPLTLRIEASKDGLLSWPGRRTDRVSALPFEISDVMLLLDRPREIQGRVVEVFGDRTIPGARVFARSDDFVLGEEEPRRIEAQIFVAMAGPDGTFGGPIPDHLAGVDLLVEAEGHLPVLAYWHHEVQKSRDDLTVRLPRPEELPRLKGRVVDAEGRPVPSAAVLIDGPRSVPYVNPVLGAAAKAYWDYRESRSRESNKAVTDAEGRYYHQLCSPGVWSVATMHAGFLEAREIEIPEAAEVECDLCLATRPVVFAGTVRSRTTGLPVAGARVEVVYAGSKWYQPTTFVTDADGGFRYGPAPRQTAGFEVTAPRHAWAEVARRPEPHEEESLVVIELEPECRLRGRAVDDRGEAIPGAHVTAYCPPVQVLARARSGQDGSFDVGGLPAARRFTLAVESGLRRRSMEVVLESAGEVRDLGAIALREK